MLAEMEHQLLAELELLELQRITYSHLQLEQESQDILAAAVVEQLTAAAEAQEQAELAVVEMVQMVEQV
jgi:hypothetical protein